MWRGIIAAVAATVLVISAADAHGGGGGFVYIPMFIGSGPSMVPAAQNGDYSRIHTVAIISAIGNGLTLHDSVIWSGPDQPPVDIKSWGIDARVEDELTRFLGNRYTIKHVEYDRAGIEALENGKGAIDPVARLRDKLHVIPNDGVDAFIVVRPDIEGDMMGPPGLGVENRSDMRPLEWANYEIDIIDAHTLMVIGHAASRLQTRAGGVIGFPGLYRNDGFAVDGKTTPTAAQLAQMQKDLTTLVTMTMVSTLRSLNLGVVLPQPGERVMVPVPEDKRPKIKTVAVLSAIGDTIRLDYHAPFFVHDVSTVPIADWNLDQEIEADVTAALDKRLIVKPMTADRAKIAKLCFPLPKENLSLPVDGLTSSLDIDLYILIIKASDRDTVCGLREETWTGDQTTKVFANYAIALIDPKSLKPIYIRPGLTSPTKPSNELSSGMNNEEWPEKSVYTTQQTIAVHRALSDILADSVPETLMHLNLIGMMRSSDLLPIPPTNAEFVPPAAPAQAAAPAPPSQKPTQ